MSNRPQITEQAAGFITGKLPKAADDFASMVSSRIPLGSSNAPETYRDLGDDVLVLKVAAPGVPTTYVVHRWDEDAGSYMRTGEQFTSLDGLLKKYPAPSTVN